MVKKNYIETLKGLAEGGDMSAMAELAERYRDGIGVRKNWKRAFKLFLEGAKRGDPYLTYFLADAYQYGEGVAPSMEKALEYYRIAASLGETRAMTSLGVYYVEEHSSSPDYETAIKYTAYIRRSGHTKCCAQGYDEIECSCFVRNAGAAPWIASPTA